MRTVEHAIREMSVLVATPSDDRQCILSKLAEDGFSQVQWVETGGNALSVLSGALARKAPIDLVILSTRLPDRPGLEAFQDLHSVFDVALMVLASHAERKLVAQSIGRVATDYLLTPVNLDLLLLKTERLLTRRFLRRSLHNSTARNETLFLNVLAVMAKVLEAKDPHTRFHSEKVAALGSLIAREMGVPEDEVRRIGIAGMLHDIGKMGIREAILTKPGPLDAEERQMVERHPIIASTILEPIEQLHNAVKYIKHHHERFEGGGYPEGLSGQQIPLGARIIHVAEAFDAMVTRRSYNLPLTMEDALAELQRCAGTQFDPEVVNAAVKVLRRLEVYPDLPLRSLPALLDELGQAPLEKTS